MTEMSKEIIKTIKNAVVSVPGVASFSNYKAKTLDEKFTTEIANALEITNTDDLSLFKIHIILVLGINVVDVMNEIQIRVRYELQKNSNFKNKYLVDVIVDDFASF